MEVQLDAIIGKIRSYGIEQSEQESNEMIAQARSEADKIVDDAKSEADRIIADAHIQADTLVDRGKDALKQAERDVVLVVKDKLAVLLQKFIHTTIQDTLSADRLADIIKSALSKWNFDTNDSLFVHLSEEDAKHITNATINGAVQSQGGTIEIHVNDAVSKGFLLSRDKDGALRYDFTDEAVSRALCSFLTQNLRALLS